MWSWLGEIVSDSKKGLGMAEGSARPAWPVLVLVQLLVVLGIAATAWSLTSSESVERAPILERLSDLDADVAEESIQHALQIAKSPLALEESGQRELASFLARTAQDIELDWVGVEFEMGSVSSDVRTVVARLTLRGSPFLVPVYLAELEEYPALGVVERFEAQPLGEDGDLFRLDIAYTRPTVVETDWVEEAVTDNQDAVGALVDAAHLQAWRAYAENEALREARARAVHEALAWALPEGLTTLRRSGTGFLWTPTHGLEPLRSGH